MKLVVYGPAVPWNTPEGGACLYLDGEDKSL